MPISLPLPRFDWGGVRWGGGIASNPFAPKPENKIDALGRLSYYRSLHVNIYQTIELWRNETHVTVNMGRFFGRNAITS